MRFLGLLRSSCGPDYVAAPGGVQNNPATAGWYVNAKAIQGLRVLLSVAGKEAIEQAFGRDP